MRIRLRRTALSLVIAATGAIGACAGNGRPADARVVQQTGTLRIAAGAVSAGHTGWTIQPGQGQPAVDADVSRVMARARELDGHHIRAWGWFSDSATGTGGHLRVFNVQQVELVR
jgi:hypothetical protein